MSDAVVEKQLQGCEASRNEGLIEPVVTKKETTAAASPVKKKKDKNHPKFNVREYLQRIYGVDVLAI